MSYGVALGIEAFFFLRERSHPNQPTSKLKALQDPAYLLNKDATFPVASVRQNTMSRVLCKTPPKKKTTGNSSPGKVSELPS